MTGKKDVAPLGDHKYVSCMHFMPFYIGHLHNHLPPTNLFISTDDGQTLTH